MPIMKVFKIPDGEIRLQSSLSSRFPGLFWAKYLIIPHLGVWGKAKKNSSWIVINPFKKCSLHGTSLQQDKCDTEASDSAPLMNRSPLNDYGNCHRLIISLHLFQINVRSL